MELRVLGALSAQVNDTALDLGGRQQRLVLALLVAASNNVVSLDRLLDDMWGEEVPTSARKAVQGYVSNLRKVLGPDIIRTEPTGYRLLASALNLDALAFEESLAAVWMEPDQANRSAALTEALAAWRGRPYEDLEDVEALAAEIARLNEMRLTASEDLMEVEIDLGRSAQVTAAAAHLAADHPFRERTRGLQMRALYAVGRQREALQVYQDLRQVLATEVGVEPSAALTELEAQILTQDESLVRRVDTRTALKPANPFRGLRPFDEQSGDEFFGRDKLVRRLVEHMDRATDTRLTLVAGASGAGKSSVVRAGLVPALERDGHSTSTTVVSGGSAWINALVGCTDDMIVVDQLEAGLSTPTEAARTLAAIADCAQQPDRPWIVATVRADYLDVLLSDPAIGLLVEPALVFVPPMTDHELAKAIVGPAARVGVQVADGLKQLLVADMRQRAAGLPLLQYALTETYDANNAGEMSLEDYRSVGGLGGALARRAEALVQPMAQARRDLLRTSMLRLVTLDVDGQPSLQRVLVADLTTDQREVLELFGSHRMVTFDGGAAPSVSISHEALMREWPTFARWIDDAREDLVARRRLSVAAGEWEAEGRPPSLLFGPALVARYDEGIEAQPRSADAEFLAASRSAVEADQRRRRWVQRGIAVVVGTAAIAAAIFALVARSDRQGADEQRQVAEAQRANAEQRVLVSEALLQSQSDPELGLLLAIQAYNAEPALESLRPILSVLAGFSAELAVFDDFAGQFSLVGAFLSFGDESNGSLRAIFRCTVELGPGAFLVAGEGEEFGFINSAESTGTSIKSPTDACQISVNRGRTRGLGQSTILGGTTLFNLASGAVEARSVEINDARFVENGRVLGFANPLEKSPPMGDQAESTELLWSDPSLTNFNSTGVTATAMYPNRSGSLIVLSDEVTQADGQRAFDLVHRYVVDAGDLSVVYDLGVVERTPTQITWSPDGALFGDVSESGRLRVWDARSGELVVDDPVAAATMNGVWLTFDPTNERVALVFRDGSVTIRTLEDPARVTLQVRRLSGSDTVEAADASFIDSETIAVLLADGTVEITTLNSSALTVETIQRAEIASPLVAAGWVGQGRAYGLTNATEIVDIAAPGRRSSPLASDLTPMIAGIAATSVPNRVHVWAADLGTPAHPGSLQTVEVDLSTLEAVADPTVIELLPGTEFAAALRDRVVAQNAGGTIFQFGYDGDRLAARVDLSFGAIGIAQSPSTSRALVAGSGQLVLVDLDTGDIIKQAEADVGPPLVWASEDLAVIARLNGDIELWSVAGLQSIGPIVPRDKRGRDETLTVSSSGALWYHSALGSQRIAIDGDILAETACRLAGRSLTEDEWRRYVSTTDPFEPAC